MHVLIVSHNKCNFVLCFCHIYQSIYLLHIQYALPQSGVH